MEKKQLLSKYWDPRLAVISGILGLLFGLFLVFGYQLEEYGNVDFSAFSTYGAVVLVSLLMMLVTGLCLKGISRISVGGKRQQRWRPGLYFVFATGLLLLFWMPQVLGVYPGYYNYDAPGQYEMFVNQAITAHHPPLHTMVMGWIIHTVYSLTGAFNKGVFAYVLFQMLLCASCFAYALTWIYGRKLSRLFSVIAFIWFGFFPTILLNVFSTTKDTLFSAFLVVFLVLTLELLERPEECLKKKGFVCGWVIMTFLTAVMRNNAIYVMVLFLPVVFWRLRKYWKRALLVYAGVLALYLLYVGPFTACFVVKGVSTNEFLTVPTQQLMRVYYEERDDLTEEELENYTLLFEDHALQNYNPKISDAVKAHFRVEEFAGNKEKYIGFWLELGKRYPDTYINSFLHNTYGFWYPKATLALTYSGWNGYFSCTSYWPAENNSKIPLIGAYYDLFQESELVHGDSFSVIFFAPATFFWLFLLVLAYMLWQKRMSELLVLGFVLVLWLTFLLGPVALVRYVAFLFYLIPVEIALVVD